MVTALELLFSPRFEKPLYSSCDWCHETGRGRGMVTLLMFDAHVCHAIVCVLGGGDSLPSPPIAKSLCGVGERRLTLALRSLVGSDEGHVDQHVLAIEGVVEGHL
jgi:hypothetical protein